MKKAYSYVRFSSAEQAKGDSLRRQLALSDAYVKKNNLELDSSLKLTDLGVSAFRGKNRTQGALSGFFKAIEKGAVAPGSVLLVESLDRLSRDEITQAMTSFLQIINAGITVVTISDDMVYSKKTINANMGSLMMSVVIMSRAHEESANKSRRLVASWENKRASIGTKKLTSICPEWLKLNAERTQYLEIPERVALIKRIFELHCSGYGKRRIAQTINAEKIPVWTHRTKKVDGWHPSYIASILKSRALLGEFHPHRLEQGKRVPVGEPIAGYFPPVISLSQWQQANRERVHSGGKTSNAVSNLFAGISFDGESEIKMVYIDKGPKHRKHRYLQSDRRRLEDDARTPLWNYEETEAAFLRAMADLDWPNILGHGKSDAAREMMEKIALLEETRRDCNKKISRLTEAITSSTQALQPLVIALENLTSEKKALDASIRENKAALQQMESENIRFRHNIGAFREMLAGAGDSKNVDLRLRLREEIRSKIKRIGFYHSGWTRLMQTKKRWLNPNSLLILFQNGAARVVQIQPGKPGEPVEIRLANAAAHEEAAPK